MSPVGLTRPTASYPIADRAVRDVMAHYLAERAALSERQLSRVFQRQTGTTPARFVERVRVEAARDLLEASALPVRTVAERCGFVYEGCSERYLKVGGRWRDHERWAIRSETWRALR